ncbi:MULTISPECIES: hypothetical protein [Clostridium]|uniref:Uncharacterized protein n=1 Tax=Clostridium cibarium TaxID=2762247 RepID=A0ABR8PWE7_9CLOT|nr:MULTISPECIES: hypothetical protein [Clostridium]MBD7912481.1 hypothetical protein [Clostridium cibarium]
MKLDFLNQQYERMKKIGAYSLLFRNSISKRTLDKYGFTEGYEQDNLIISVLVFIMEQSLKEEPCTIDDIAVFIDEVNNVYYKKQITFEDSKEIAEFIVNTVLCNEGKAMYFKAMNFKKGDYEDINISFLKNKIDYIEDVRRVVYRISEDGYELILSTLEVEESLKITIKEIIFKLHLQKASYEKAVDDIKDIFRNMKSRIENMDEDIRRIKELPLSYSVDEYKKITEGNLEILRDSNKKFQLHRESIEDNIKEFENKEINIRDLTEEEEENLKNLRVINEYLGRTIDEEQKILLKHYDLKEIYRQELENISKMSLIERFDLKKELYNKILENPKLIGSIDRFLAPLFLKEPIKSYNINKAFTYQTLIKEIPKENDETLLNFAEDESEDWINKKKKERIEKCNVVISTILELALDNGKITLKNLAELTRISEITKTNLLPTVEIFREVMVEMIKSREINIKELKEERKSFIDNGEIEFQLNKSILEIMDLNPRFQAIQDIKINKLEKNENIRIENIIDENGNYKNFICSDLSFEVITKEGR